MTLKFEEWLINQQDREDVIGDFARVLNKQDVLDKVSTRKQDEHKNWADIVIKIVQPGYIGVFNAAWQEFLLARQEAAKDT